VRVQRPIGSDVARAQPEEGRTAAEDVPQQRHRRLPMMMVIVMIIVIIIIITILSRRRRSGFGVFRRRRRPSPVLVPLELVDGRLVAAYGGELVAHDGDDEEAVEDGDNGEEDGVENFALLRLDMGGDRIQDPRREYQHDAGARYQPNVDEELNEVFLIPLSNAIVYPRAVVIHSAHAASAYATMMRTWRPIRLAFRAQRPTVWTLGVVEILVAQVDGRVADGNHAGIGEDRPQMRRHHQRHEKVEGDDEEGAAEATVEDGDD